MYRVGRKGVVGRGYLISGYEYIRNRASGNRTFLRCRFRKKCHAKAVIFHATNKAVVTSDTHVHPPPKEINLPLVSDDSKMTSSSDSSFTHEEAGNLTSMEEPLLKKIKVEYDETLEGKSQSTDDLSMKSASKAPSINVTGKESTNESASEGESLLIHSL